MNFRDLTEKARAIEEDHKHRFTVLDPKKTMFARSSFPSPRKDRSSGVYYFACVDCGRQLYHDRDRQIIGTAIDGGRCEI